MQVTYLAAYGFNMFNLVLASTCHNSGHIHTFPHVQDSNGMGTCTYSYVRHQNDMHVYNCMYKRHPWLCDD